MPDPILVGRSEDKLRKAGRSARRTASPGSRRTWMPRSPTRSTPIYFDSQTTDRRADAVRKAIARANTIYCEKPTAVDVEDRL
jgi:hypothetical protein